MTQKFALASVIGDGPVPRPALKHDSSFLVLSDIATDDRFAALRVGSMLDLFANWDAALPACHALADAIAAGEFAGRLIPEAAARIDAPLMPRQIFCTGANYFQHVVDIIVERFPQDMRRDGEDDLPLDEVRKRAEAMMRQRAETGEPYIFPRIVTSCAGPYDDLILPDFATQPDWEAELAIVFGRGGHKIPREKAMEHVAGYMVVNDLTSRDQIFTADPKSLGADWLHAKHTPGFFPMGPHVLPAEFVKDPYDLGITLTLNGKKMQDERTSDMIFDIARQIETLSKYVKILPGDVLATGSPAGNGTHYNRYLKPGDVMEASVEGLGTQRTVCQAPT